MSYSQAGLYRFGFKPVRLRRAHACGPAPMPLCPKEHARRVISYSSASAIILRPSKQRVIAQNDMMRTRYHSDFILGEMGQRLAVLDDAIVSDLN
jgi:hypothetical protein